MRNVQELDKQEDGDTDRSSTEEDAGTNSATEGYIFGMQVTHKG